MFGLRGGSTLVWRRCRLVSRSQTAFFLLQWGGECEMKKWSGYARLAVDRFYSAFGWFVNPNKNRSSNARLGLYVILFIMP